MEAGNRSLRRGLQVLDALLAPPARAGLRVVDLCRACGLERPTLYRLLETLVDSGYVQRQGRFRYVPGPRVQALAQPPQDGLTARLRPVLARVSEACGDAAFAVVREGGLSHCIARHVGTHPVQILVVQVGRRQPLGVGAAGLALLAALPPAEVEAVVAANAAALPGYGGMTAARMAILVRATRERGWSLVGNHVAANTLAVGMAVPGAAEGAPLAAISVAAPQERMPGQRQRLIVRFMREALADL